MLVLILYIHSDQYSITKQKYYCDVRKHSDILDLQVDTKFLPMEKENTKIQLL